MKSRLADQPSCNLCGQMKLALTVQLRFETELCDVSCGYYTYVIYKQSIHTTQKLHLSLSHTF